jgi:gliding motility-associated lipoprotein GldH
MFNVKLKTSYIVLLTSYLLSSCTTIDLYEKNVPVPGHNWKSSFQPEFTFSIKDTSSSYQVFFIIRHSEKYNYNNIWINLYSQPPGDTMHKVPYELQLATNEKGWLASGLDDIYEHRIKLTDEIRLKAGEYKLRIENIMREDPLMHVMSVGLRVEKKQ